MAYRFGQHVAPPQEHHRYSHQSAATATAGLGSYDTGGPPSAYHPHRFQGRERRHSDLSGSQVPAYVQREQLAFGDRGNGGREGRDGRGEQFHQDPGILLSSSILVRAPACACVCMYVLLCVYKYTSSNSIVLW